MKKKSKNGQIIMRFLVLGALAFAIFIIWLLLKLYEVKMSASSGRLI